MEYVVVVLVVEVVEVVVLVVVELVVLVVVELVVVVLVVVLVVVVLVVVEVLVPLEQHKVLGEIRADYVLLYHRTLVETHLSDECPGVVLVVGRVLFAG